MGNYGGGFRKPVGFGGTQSAVYATLAYTDTTAKALFTLPRGAVITDYLVTIETEFNDSGTDLIIVGTAADDDLIVDDLAGGTAGTTRAGAGATTPTAGLWTTPLASDTPIYGKFTGQNGDASAGALTFVLWYMLL